MEASVFFRLENSICYENKFGVIRSNVWFQRRQGILNKMSEMAELGERMDNSSKTEWMAFGVVSLETFRIEDVIS